MNLSERDRRALIVMAVVVLVGLVLHFAFSDSAASSNASLADPSKDAIALAQQRLARLRQIAATGPARDAVLKQVSSDLADREHGIIQAPTAAEAQATLLEIARRIGKDEQIDVRGGELGAPKAFGDYGLVSATITFECHIEQLVNFLADLSHVPELIVPSEERITSGNAKDKTMGVRIVLAGVIPKKLVPEKKGLAAF